MKTLPKYRGLIVLIAFSLGMYLGVSQTAQAAASAGQLPAAGAPLPVDVIKSAVEFGAGWEGIWEWQNEFRDCETGFLLFQTTTRDTLCAGDVYDPEGMDGVLPLNCEGIFGDTEVHLECSGLVPVEGEPGCTADYFIIIDWTLTDNMISGEQTIEATFAGDCSQSGPFCMRLVTTGTRIDPDPQSCAGTPVRVSTWGALKSTYR